MVRIGGMRMVKHFNNIINYSVVLTILFFLIGVILILFPDMKILTISYAISILLILLGLVLAIYSMNKIYLINFLSFGVLQVILGTIILIYPYALITLLPIAVGVWMILKSTIDFRVSLILKKGKVKDWIYVAILSILAIICGIMLIVKTEIGTIELTVIVGIFLTAYSLTSIIDIAIFKENINTIAKQLGFVHK